MATDIGRTEQMQMVVRHGDAARKMVVEEG